MARPGITYHEVLQVIQQLLAENSTPTVERVRQRLGTGSHTSIARHLQTWRTHHQQAGKPEPIKGLPSPLVAAMHSLWETVQAETEAKITAAEKACATANEKLTSQLQESQAAFHSLQKEQNALQERFYQAEQQILLLGEKITQADLTVVQLQTQNQALTDQLTVQQAENSRLHHLCERIQQNLEHYQEEQQKLRQQEALQQEKDRLQHTKEVRQLRQRLGEEQHERQLAEANAKRLDEDSQGWQQKFAASQTEIQRLQQENHALSVQWAAAQQQVNAHQSSFHQLQEHYEKLREEYQTLEKNCVLLADNYGRLEKEQGRAEGLIKLLRQEKIEALQEAAALSGQLKQLEKSLKTRD